MTSVRSLRPVSFWYYRDQRAREIDFVLEQGGRLSLIECKWREHPDVADATSSPSGRISRAAVRHGSLDRHG